MYRLMRFVFRLDCDGRLDICIVLDASGSIRNERFPAVLELVVNVIDQFEVSPTKTRFAALKYSDDAVWLFDLDTYTSKQDVKTSIRRTTFIGGKTNTASALSMMVGSCKIVDGLVFKPSIMVLWPSIYSIKMYSYDHR